MLKKPDNADLTEPSRSRDRHTFQLEGYIKRCKDEGKEPNPNYVAVYKSWREQDEENLKDPEWQKNNLEWTLRTTDWILAKVRTDDTYAQRLYATLCNNDFVPPDVWKVLKNETWSCSWRYAGGIVADMQEKGDYIDWYCSGNEGEIFRDVEQDLNQLGWRIVGKPL